MQNRKRTRMFVVDVLEARTVLSGFGYGMDPGYGMGGMNPVMTRPKAETSPTIASGALPLIRLPIDSAIKIIPPVTRRTRSQLGTFLG